MVTVDLGEGKIKQIKIDDEEKKDHGPK
jgi:hypothetical protein